MAGARTCPGPGPSPARAAPLEVYGKLPTIESVALAPDGKAMAMATTDGETRRIVITNLATGKVSATVDAGEDKVRFIQWAGANHLIITIGVTSDLHKWARYKWEYWVAMDLNIPGRKLTPLVSNFKSRFQAVGTHNFIWSVPVVRLLDGHPFVFVQSQVGDRDGLLKVDLDHDDLASVVNLGFEDTDAYLVDAKGQPAAETEYDGESGHWLLRTWNGQWSPSTRDKALIERPNLLGLGRDGVSIAVLFPGEKHGTLRELSPDGKTWTPPVSTDADYIWDPATYRMIGETNLVGDERTYTFYSPKDQAAWNSVLKAYPGNHVTLWSFSDDHRKFIVLADSPTEGAAFALVDLNAKRGDWIGALYPALEPKDIAETRPVTFKAKDGLELHGYLTLPRGRPAKALPLIMFPHGGPQARDEPGFDWWAQAMASRGYAVLQVNYRGSSGYGWDFQAAGFGEWGRKMQTDLSDGVRWLAGQGTIDPTRVCIVGASYGGYAALAGASIDTGVYRCAIAVAGISNPHRMIERDKWLEGDQGDPTKRYWLRYMGPEAKLPEISPLFQIDRVSIPILMVHGQDDTTVPFEQSQMMAAALRKAGKTVDLVTLANEDHYLSRGETRLLMLQSVVAFLEHYNPPD